jgi:hypothetical protein
MTTAISESIEFLLSGGTNNSDPGKSLGGPPSGFPVLGIINNLFSDITTDQAESGKVDYRCFYVKNSNPQTLYEAKIQISSQDSGGSTVQLGTASSTEVQRIDVTGVSISGTLVLRIGSTPISMNWGSSPAEFAASLANALSLVLFSAQISHSVYGDTASFTVTFTGKDDKKEWPRMEIQENNLTGVDKPIVSTRKISGGQPTNSSAPIIATESLAPAGVVFSSGIIQIGDMQSGDFVPVWVKRTTPAGAELSQNDNFTVKVSAKPFLFGSSSSSQSLVSSSSSSSSSSSGVGIYYEIQPASQTFYYESATNQTQISCRVVMTGSAQNSPVALWEFSDNGGVTWKGIGIFPNSSMSVSMFSTTPGIIEETLTLLNIGPSWSGRRFRVTNSEGSVSARSNEAVLTVVNTLVSSSSSSSSLTQFGFVWVTQPSNSSFNYQNGATFFWEIEHGNQLSMSGNPVFEYSDDGGVNYTTHPSNAHQATMMSTLDPNSNKTFVSGTFKISTLASSRRYRVKLTVGSVEYTSTHAFAVCAATECSQYWPVGYAGPAYSADCGLLPMPGYEQHFDCSACECVSTPVSSSSSSPA